ncbi:MAG: DUF2059 domain-containing protein [Polaromonas sp.]|nr:DUF2059 domain-containing protein [Polaromonas sp.]
MKKLMLQLLLASTACAALAPLAYAQTAVDPKTEWASKVVTLQQGPELERLVAQLADSASQELIANWGPKLDTNVPKARLKKATDDLNAELAKYGVDATKLISKQIARVSTDVLVPAYTERFSLDELKQLAAFFESPAIKKYQSLAPELGNIFVQKLVEASRADVAARGRQFDDVAVKIVGAGSANAPADSGKVRPKK